MTYDIARLIRAESWQVDFDSSQVTYGAGSVERLGTTAAALGLKRALLVTMPELADAGHVDQALRSLAAAGVGAEVFDGVCQNPTTATVAAGVDAARASRADGLIGFGGGSAMDCAKGVNFLLTQGGALEDYRGHGKATRPMLSSIGVPTTAGTGSEAQSYALITREDSGEKMACGDPRARFRAVILDPQLTRTLPRQVTAITGIDAITHAVESYVASNRNTFSQLYAREAWKLLAASFETVLREPGDEAARGKMLLGAHLAGLAIEHSMLGAAHACANPLTAGFGVTHGVAVGLMLPATIAFNTPEVGTLYDELHPALYDRVCELRAAAGLHQRLAQAGVPREALRQLAAAAATQWTAGYNPRPVGAGELLSLYEAAY